MDEAQRWLPSVLAAVAVIVFIVRAEQAGRTLKVQMDKLEKFREEHLGFHVSIGESIVEHRVRLENLEREGSKDHERIRDLQIRSNVPRDPH